MESLALKALSRLASVELPRLPVGVAGRHGDCDGTLAAPDRNKEQPMETILVTGGAGFIGSCFVRQWITEEQACIVNLDKQEPAVVDEGL